MNALLLVLAVAAVSDPRLKDAERLAASGDIAAARAAITVVHDELAKSGADTSAALHYNLGTLALLDDDLGAAVVHLLAADRRAPGNDDVKHNLELALARRADQVQGARQAPLGTSLPPGVVRALAGVVWGLLGIALALTALGGRPARFGRAAARPLVVVAVIACALLAARIVAEDTAIAVVQRDTRARPQPDASAEGFEVHAGLTGRVVDERDGFSRLRLENGVDVWVGLADLAVVP